MRECVRPHKRIFETLICPLPSGPSLVLPVHSTRSSDHSFRWPPCLPRPGIVPSIISFSEAWREMWPKWPKYFSLRLFTIGSNFLFWLTLSSTVLFVTCHDLCMRSSYFSGNIAFQKPSLVMLFHLSTYAFQVCEPRCALSSLTACNVLTHTSTVRNSILIN